MSRTQLFPWLPAFATFVEDTEPVPETQKNVFDFFQKYFVATTNVSSFARPRNIMSYNMSATMCPHLPPTAFTNPDKKKG